MYNVSCQYYQLYTVVYVLQLFALIMVSRRLLRALSMYADVCLKRQLDIPKHPLGTPGLQPLYVYAT